MERKGRNARNEDIPFCLFAGFARFAFTASVGHWRYHTGMTIFAVILGLAAAQAAPAPTKIEIVSVTGCLKETTPNNWTLASATDPVPSGANAPPAKDIPPVVPAGKNEFKLIGVSEFNLSAHRDHTVIIKGLFIKAAPTSRVNMTSIAMVAPTCAPAPAK